MSCGDLNRFVTRNTCRRRVTSFLRLLNSRQGSEHIAILDVLIALVSVREIYRGWQVTGILAWASLAEQGKYLIESILRACDVLQAFRFEGETLRLRDLVERTGINKTTAFRLMKSLEKGNLIEVLSAGRYRTTIRPIHLRKLHLGYAAQGSNLLFSQEVTASISRAADTEKVALLALSNEFSPKVALRNAEKLIKARVDIAIEHQTFEDVAPLIAGRFREAKIPLIAVGFPHPGAVYYGANNYEAGLIAGRALGRWAKQRWECNVDEIMMLGRVVGGSVPQLRMQGMERGMAEILGEHRSRIVHVNGDGHFEGALRAVRRHLRFGDSGKTLVAAINDPSALGALRSFEEAGRTNSCAVVGLGGSTDARAELRRPGTRLVGSVAFFPENYGPDLIAIATGILGHKPTPNTVFINHKLLTTANVDHHYPNDSAFSNDDPMFVRFE
ncbi:MAG: periplasmic binding protein/LacI transcriptional regulator [Bryobacterales bacterium]|nr:periplasmic binding protein/LacI transcriptional regulator [Bryobacterales bacterium]